MIRVRRWIVTMLALIALGVGGVARGQEDDEPVELVAPQQMFEYSDENFDQWVFGNSSPNAVQGRKRLESLLALQIDDLERTCQITEFQKKKLLLAGRGDIKKFFDRMEDMRKEFRKVKNDQNKIGEIFQKIQPLQMQLNSGMFGEESLYHKAIKNTLDSKQAELYGQVDLDRRRFRYKSKIALTVAMLENGMPLQDDQRQKLLRLVETETEPLKRFGQYDYYAVMLQIARLPEARLKPLFDDGQWRMMKKHLEQARGMEQFLKQQGQFDGGVVAVGAAVVEVRADEADQKPAEAADKQPDQKNKKE